MMGQGSYDIAVGEVLADDTVVHGDDEGLHGAGVDGGGLVDDERPGGADGRQFAVVVLESVAEV